MLSPALTVLVFLLVLSLQREKTNMHTVLNIFISASFLRFCKLLSSQASSSLVFGINFFCVYAHLFFFFFFT